MIPITIGDTTIHPNDFVFGDCDGVVIIPKALAVEVLFKTEEIVQRENGMRADLEKGVTSILVTRPIALTILILAAFTTITGIRRQRKSLQMEEESAAAAAAASRQGLQG